MLLRSLLLLAALVLGGSGCGSNESPASRPTATRTAPPTPTAALRAPVPPALPALPSAELIAKACHAEDADASSTVFVAIRPDGQPARLVVTPSRTIADMGNLILDMNGDRLGTDLGGEFPWDDAAAVTAERARVAALMGDAVVPEGAQPLTCDS